jgi:hypothetical protein
MVVRKKTQDVYWLKQRALHPVQVGRVIRTEFAVGGYKQVREGEMLPSLLCEV